jgi:hypothetical protein
MGFNSAFKVLNKNRYVSGKPVPGVEPGTGGFNGLSESTFIGEHKVSPGYTATVLKFRFDSQHESCGNK